AGRVDRTVARRDRAQPGLERPQAELVAPVGPLLVVASLGTDEAHRAAGVADVGVGECAAQRAQGPGLPGRVRIREGEQLAPAGGDAGVLGADLPAARELEDTIGAGSPGP